MIKNRHLILVQIIAFALPIIPVWLFGLFSIIQEGYGFHFAGISLISVLIIRLFYSWQKKENKKLEDQYQQESFVEASYGWSDKEQQIWTNINVTIKEQLKQNADWPMLKDHSLTIVKEIAKAFDKKELDLTPLECLQLTEEIISRYRQVLSLHVPGIDSVKLSHIKQLYDANNKYDLMKFAGWGMKGLQVVRLVLNPAATVTNEIRSQMLGHFSENLQYNAKQALLQEVAKTSIDLYSGRFKIEKSEIKASKISEEDLNNLAPALEPIRVTIVGQISSGKSSLVNALTKEAKAEIDMLPSTEKRTVHKFSIDGQEQLHLIDTAGLDGDKKTMQSMVKEITQSDLVMWVLKANQSSRQLDVALQAKLNDFYASPKNISRKKPRIIGILNQVDRLKPIDEWQPPYDLSLPSAKTKTINAAIEYNHSLLALDKIYPLALPQQKMRFGLEALQEEIQTQYEHAKNIQLNRQRNDTKKAAPLLAKRLFNIGKTVVQFGLN